MCTRGGVTPSLVAQFKVNMFNIWPKINTLISSFNFFRGVRGFAMKIMTPTGRLTGLGVIFPRGSVGGSYPCGCFKMLKWLSALILFLIFPLIFEKLKIRGSPALILTSQIFILTHFPKY